eukprot:3435523-Amphidinium_carterae.1
MCPSSLQDVAAGSFTCNRAARHDARSFRSLRAAPRQVLQTFLSNTKKYASAPSIRGVAARHCKECDLGCLQMELSERLV